MPRISQQARRNYDRGVEELRPAEIQVPEQLRSKHRKGPHNIHQCYKKAWEYAVDHEVEGMRVVHGTYGGGLNIDHAWVELPEGVLFDGVTQRFYQREGYYSISKAIKEVEYDVITLCRLLGDEGHFGPFHETFWQAKAREFRTRTPPDLIGTR